MNRKICIKLIMTLLTACVLLAGCSKKPQKIYRVGIVSGVDIFIGIADGFKTEMAEQGYAEGRNITYDIRATNADPAAVEQAVKEFANNKVDLILAFPTEPALAAKAAAEGTNIPVVFASAGIEGANLIDNISVPGGNITGCRYPGPELTAKRLEILHEFVPQAKRIFIIYDKNYPMMPNALEQLRIAAASLLVTLAETPISSIEELETVLKQRSAMADIGVDAILIMPELITQSPVGWPMVAKFAYDHNIPIGGSAGFEAETGAIFSYIPDNVETGKLAAQLADKIFKGTPAGTIMVVTPPSRLRINYNAAQRLGITIPESLLNRANEIIR